MSAVVRGNDARQSLTLQGVFFFKGMRSVHPIADVKTCPIGSLLVDVVVGCTFFGRYLINETCAVPVATSS